MYYTRVVPPQGSRDPSRPFTSSSSQSLYREDSGSHIAPQGPYRQPYNVPQRLRNQSTSYSDPHPHTMMPTPQVYNPDSSPSSSPHSGYSDPAPAYGSDLGTSPPHNYSPSMRSFRSTEVAPTDDNVRLSNLLAAFPLKFHIFTSISLHHRKMIFPIVSQTCRVLLFSMYSHLA